MVMSHAPASGAPRSNNLTVALWIVQGLLALLFLFAGGMKLVLPIESMTEQMPMPGWFLRFIGVAEALGGLGLILPGLVARRRRARGVRCVRPVAAGAARRAGARIGAAPGELTHRM
jgi:hypothetical protein